MIVKTTYFKDGDELSDEDHMKADMWVVSVLGLDLPKEKDASITFHNVGESVTYSNALYHVYAAGRERTKLEMRNLLGIS